jgi:hypothetical protein
MTISPDSLREAAIKAAGDQRTKDETVTVSGWPMPADLWAQIPPTPPLPRALLPTTIEAFAFGKPETFSPAALAGAALAVCAVAASDHVRLVINPTWREAFRIWVALYGPSSAAKTPIMQTAWRAIEKEQNARFEEYREELGRFEAAKKAAKKAGEEFDDAKPQLVRYYTHSATMAAITELERNSEHGVGLVHNELSALIAAMDGGVYREKSAERGDWLALYDGGQHFCDRITRPGCLVRNHSATILGGITTDKLARVVRDSVAHGLMSRMSLVTVPVMPPSADLSAIPYDTYCEFQRLVSRLARGRPAREHDVQLAEEAPEVLGAAKQRWQQEAVLYSERLPRYAERLGKLPALAARFALGFALIEGAEAPGIENRSLALDVPAPDPPAKLPRIVTPSQMQRAGDFTDHLAHHDLAFYATAAGQDVAPAMAMARRVGTWLLQWTRTSFQLGDLTRGILEWRSLKNTDQLATLELLERLDWIRPDLEPADGAQICTFFVGQQFVRGVTWHVNPRAHQRYQQQAEAARRTAAELKRRLTENIAEYRSHGGTDPP